MDVKKKLKRITAVFSQVGFRASFDAFFVYFNWVLRIKFGGKIPPERNSANLQRELYDEQLKKVYKLPEFVSFFVNYYCEFCFVK
jgi:hypothetical protein